MQVVLKQQSEQVLLQINSTQTTKQALQHDNLSARERQLLLLIDKDDSLSAQAVAKLLDKVDLKQLASRGLLTYQRQIKTKASDGSVTTQPVSTTKSNQFKGVKLQGFMQAYANETQESQTITTRPMAVQTQEIILDKAVAALATDKYQPSPKLVLNQPAYQEFEDIVIAQGLLEY